MREYFSIMGSPLSEAGVVNSVIIYNASDIPELTGGRYVASEGVRYMLRCYLKLIDSKGYEIGRSPSFGLESKSGGETNTWIYRGYVIEFTTISNDYVSSYERDELISNWVSILGSSVPGFGAGSMIRVRHGSRGKMLYGSVQSYSGKYGGVGIDEIIEGSIGGKAITIRAGETM